MDMKQFSQTDLKRESKKSHDREFFKGKGENQNTLT